MPVTSQSEAIAIIARSNEGLDHIGVLDPHQRRITWHGEVIQFRQPEVIAV